MNRRKLKQEILKVLALENMTSIQQSLAIFQPSEIINPLFSALCSTTDRVKWHAVMAFGWIVPIIADKEMELARIIMRRFLWSLNDESGGIGWGSPEAMAEILARDDRLASEYLHMLISYTREDGPELFQDGNYLELPTLQRGLLWGIGRLCLARRQQMWEAGVSADLKAYLDSGDAVVRGLAIWALTLLKDESVEPQILEMRNDGSEVPVYQFDTMCIFTIQELTESYLYAIHRQAKVDSAD